MALKHHMNIIAAVDSAFGIAKNNDLPWHLPKEYAHFVRQTTQTKDEHKLNAVVMGRKCWESIPEKYRPLKKRVNVVLSRSMAPLVNEHIIVVAELDEALKILTESDLFKHRIETIWNIGGREIYRAGLAHPWMHKLVLTYIERDFGCDLHFPDVDWSAFARNADFDDHSPVEEKGVTWRVVSYTKN